MEQTKPLFIIRRYRSILTAAIIVEAVNYIVSLTDSIVAGNLVNSSALAAIGLFAPFLSFITFLSSIIISGTTLNYSFEIGRFDKRRALEFFSHGVYMALLTGALFSAALFAFRGLIIPGLTSSAVMQQYLREYCSVILLFYLIFPVSHYLDNMTVADGGEKLSAAANIVFILSNVLLSILFARLWSVKGIAFASVVSRLLFILILSAHFFGNKGTLRLLRHWKLRDFLTIVRSGGVKASIYALEGLTLLAVNLFAVRFFDSDTLVLLVMAEKYLGLLTLFIGLAMAAQPLISTLSGENNNKALRLMMRTVSFDMLAAGLILSLLTLLFTPYLVGAFGISAEPLRGQGVVALRIVAATLPLHALLLLYFIYYNLIGRQSAALTLSVFKNLISPLVLVALFSLIFKTGLGIWLGFSLAPLVSLIVCSLLIFLRCTKKRGEPFPLLIPRDNEDRTFIYDFAVNAENAVAVSRTADAVLRGFPVSEQTRTFLCLTLEEMLMLIREKNGEKKVFAECTILVEPEGVRMILRDSGRLFDITEADARADSFRQYVVAALMLAHEYKAYLITTGYNRNELFFPSGAAEGS